MSRTLDIDVEHQIHALRRRLLERPVPLAPRRRVKLRPLYCCYGCCYYELGGLTRHTPRRRLGLANAVNNLPAYLAGEAAVPLANHTQLLALLIGTNAGPLITPWGSLAMLLWFERCSAAGLAVSKSRIAVAGTVLALLAVGGATVALAIS